MINSYNYSFQYRSKMQRGRISQSRFIDEAGRQMTKIMDAKFSWRASQTFLIRSTIRSPKRLDHENQFARLINIT